MNGASDDEQEFVKSALLPTINTLLSNDSTISCLDLPVVIRSPDFYFGVVPTR